MGKDESRKEIAVPWGKAIVIEDDYVLAAHKAGEDAVRIKVSAIDGSGHLEGDEILLAGASTTYVGGGRIVHVILLERNDENARFLVNFR